MFNEEFSYTWKQFSVFLGIDRSCELNIDKACEVYDKKIFWKEIADNRTHQMPRTSNNHNPTLRFSHWFLGLTFYSRVDIRPIRKEEMQLLYAAVNRIRVYTTRSMEEYWSKNFTCDGDVEITVHTKVDLQTQRANTRFNVKACQPIWPYNRQRW